MSASAIEHKATDQGRIMNRAVELEGDSETPTRCGTDSERLGRRLRSVVVQQQTKFKNLLIVSLIIYKIVVCTIGLQSTVQVHVRLDLSHCRSHIRRPCSFFVNVGTHHLQLPEPPSSLTHTPPALPTLASSLLGRFGLHLPDCVSRWTQRLRLRPLLDFRIEFSALGKFMSARSLSCAGRQRCSGRRRPTN
jgi:hypothetical protein